MDDCRIGWPPAIGCHGGHCAGMRQRRFDLSIDAGVRARVWPLQTVCRRSDLADECRQSPTPDVGRFLRRQSALPQNLTFTGRTRRRVYGSATLSGRRLLPLAAIGRCRPGAVLTSARLNVRKRSLSDCIPQQRRQAHYRPRRRPGGHGGDSRGAVLSRIDQYEARHATAKVTTSTVPGSDRSWCKRNTVTLPDRCSRFSYFELPISLARRRTAAPTPRSTGWAQRLSSRQIQVPQGLAERTVESARIQPVQLGRGRYTTRTQASGLLCPAAACRRVWRSTVRTSKISIL